MVPSANGQVQAIPLHQIRPSGTNPRKNFEAAKLQELADSIKVKGLLQPILVRPTPGVLPSGKEAPADVLTYQLVAGERRYRAAKLAGLKDIPCMVRDLSDKEAREVQILENDQREDLTPLERADGYADLVAHHGYTAETLAEKLHKSVSFVYSKLRLARLSEAGREAVSEELIPVAVAELVARVPNAELRDKALEDVLADDYGTVLSYRQAKEHIEEHYCRQLKGSPFDPKDATLDPVAGACTKCPKLSGNNRTEFPDGRADICTDTACYQHKLELHAERVQANAEVQGAKVLTGKAAKGLFNEWQPGKLVYNAPYVDMDRGCWEGDGKGRTWRKLIGKKVEAQLVAVVNPHTKNLHWLCPSKEATKALKDAGHLKPEQASRTMSRYDRENKKRELAAKIEKEVTQRAMGSACAAMEQSAARLELPVAVTAKFREGLRALIKNGWSDVLRLVARRRGLTDKGGKSPGHYNGNEALLEKLIDVQDGVQLLGLFAELCVGRGLERYLFSYCSDRTRDDAATTKLLSPFRINRKAIRKEVLAEAKKKAKKEAVAT